VRVSRGPSPGVRGDALTDPTGSDLPALVVGPATGSWRELGLAYLGEIGDRIRPDPDLAAEARRLCPPGTVDPAGCLLQQVARTLAYRAVEFGRRARMPHPAAEVRRLAQGDCKDHAVLLWQYLRGHGIPAHLALVSHDAVLDEDMPHLDQFSHMVVALGAGTGLRVLDATAKHLDPAIVPAGLGGARLLVLDPDGPRLETAPRHAVSGIDCRRTLRIADDGTVAAEERTAFTGYLAASLRSRCAGLSPADLRSRLRDMLDASAASVESVAIDHLDDPAVPAVLHLAWTPRAGLQRQDAALVGSLPEAWAEWLLRVPPEPARNRALACRYPFAVTVQGTVAGPAGAKLHLAAAVPADDERFFSWSGTASGPAWSCRLVQRAGDWPDGSFADWQRRCAQVCDRAGLRFIAGGR